MSDWHMRGCCDCGWSAVAPFGKLFHIHVECCPKCGKDKERFTLSKMRWNTSKIVFWNPFTWGLGFWEEYNA